ncbi:MAG: hypothetical protein RMI89_08415 [Gloeomargarita sp. SKYBB_i_bin120]|nr:hypothetical protein [Gloeomargarita sp. SKYB120]MDW8178541.1 hypothetical protein [Gloeomargarita sp. SKYBB_i_bin120]
MGLRLYCIKISVLAVLSGGVAAAQPVRPEAKLARAILTEVNQLRRDPPGYADRLGVWRAYYRGKRWQPPGQPAQRTREGLPGLLAAQAWLQQVQPLPVLRPVTALAKAAVALVPQDITALSLAAQLQRYGQWEGLASACRSQGFTDARVIVAHWLIDDGQPQRPNRSNLLNPLFRVAGVACAPRPRMTCVLTLAGGYHAKPAMSKSPPPRALSPAPRSQAPTPAASSR